MGFYDRGDRACCLDQFSDEDEEEETMEQNKFTWCVPKELGIPADSLRLRVDFFHQSTTLPLSMVTP